MSTATKVMILGSFHFMENQDINICSKKIQHEIEDLVDKISIFNPNKIIVEAPIELQHEVTDSFKNLPEDYFTNIEKMKSTILGYISIGENKYPINYCNEAIQIGYRLASKLKHSDVYGIDYYKCYDESEIFESAKSEISTWENDIENFWKCTSEDEKRIKSNGTITDLYRYMNGDWSLKQHSKLYLTLNQIGAGKDYKGADFLTRWYERNLKIFANLQKISEDTDRVLVIYGAGHLEILKMFIDQYEKMEFVDVLNYL